MNKIMENYVVICGMIYFLCALTGIILKRRNRIYLKMIKQYVERIIYFKTVSSSTQETLERLNDSLSRKNPLKGVLAKAEKTSLETEGILLSVNSYLRAWPVYITNEIVLGANIINRYTAELINEMKEQWLMYSLNSLRTKKRKLIGFYMFKELVLLVNGMLYLKTHNNTVLLVLAITNAVGILFLLLYTAFSAYKLDKNVDAGNLAFLDWAIWVQILCSEYSVREAIVKTYDHCPSELRMELKLLCDEIIRGEDSFSDYSRLYKNEPTMEKVAFINTLFNNRTCKEEEVEERLKSLISEIIRVDGQNKTQDHMQGLKSFFQVASSLGIMINVITILNTMIAGNQLVA